MAISLKTLIRRCDSEGIEAYLAEKVAKGAYQPQDNDLVSRALETVEVETAVPLLTAILEYNTPIYPVGCSDLLATVAADRDADAGLLQPTASRMVAVLPVDPNLAHAPPKKRPAEWPNANMVIDLLDALERIDPDLAIAALQRIIDAPAVYDIDEVLRPAALCLYAAEDMHGLESVERLRSHVLDYLRQRVAEPLDPPTDWSRDNPFDDADEHFVALGEFLRDPQVTTWQLQATKKVRQTIELKLQQHGCDVDCQTDTSSQPHALVCTKNERTFQAAAEARQKDWVDLATLEGVAD